METQENLETTGIGTKETAKLEPAIVKIVKASIETVGEKKAVKAVFEVKHPKSEDTIKISSAKMERKGKLEISGLWVNLDEDKKIRKNSFLAQFLQFIGGDNIKSIEGKECLTVEDEQGYLVFKGY